MLRTFGQKKGPHRIQVDKHWCGSNFSYEVQCYWLFLLCPKLNHQQAFGPCVDLPFDHPPGGFFLTKLVARLTLKCAKQAAEETGGDAGCIMTASHKE